MKILLLSSLGLLFTVVTFGQTSQTQLLDSIFYTLHTNNSFNGNVLIAEKGKIIFEKSYGFADESSKRELNKETIFELASVSKQFTAMGILLLEKQGKLKIDDKISKYIPQLDFYEEISIRNLLNHSSGLADYMELFEEHWDKTKFATNQDIINVFSTIKPKLMFKPDEKFMYSNTGYALLGSIIEKASKMPFEDYLKKYIFSPLKMENTFVYRSRFKPQKIENYALGYVLDSIGNKVLTDSFGKKFYTYYLDGIVGDGMVNSTAGDLLIWDRALYDNKLIDKNTIYQTSKTSDGKENIYSFGWFVLENENYGKILNHSGGWAGYTTFIERHITNDKTIILLQNHSLPTTKMPVKDIRRVLYNEPILVEKQIVLKPEDLDKYIGVYANESFPLKINVTKKENVLYTQATGQGAIPMDSYENDTFKFGPADIKLIFNVNEGTFELNQGGMKMIFKKE